MHAGGCEQSFSQADLASGVAVACAGCGDLFCSVRAIGSCVDLCAPIGSCVSLCDEFVHFVRLVKASTLIVVLE